MKLNRARLIYSGCLAGISFHRKTPVSSHTFLHLKFLLRRLVFCSFLLLECLFAFEVKAQDTVSHTRHDLLTGMFADVLFDSKEKAVRDRVKAFENVNGVKLQFRVDDASLDQL